MPQVWIREGEAGVERMGAGIPEGGVMSGTAVGDTCLREGVAGPML